MLNRLKTAWLNRHIADATESQLLWLAQSQGAKGTERRLQEALVRKIPNGVVSGKHLNWLARAGVFAGVFKGRNTFKIGQSSVDFSIGNTFAGEHTIYPSYSDTPVTLDGSSPVKLWEKQGPIVVSAGNFVLTSTQATFNLPSCISAMVMLRSGCGRAGLEHLQSCWINPNFSGKLTLEFTNVLQAHGIKLEGGLFLVQVVFFKHEDTQLTISKYNNYQGPVGNQGV